MVQYGRLHVAHYRAVNDKAQVWPLAIEPIRVARQFPDDGNQQVNSPSVPPEGAAYFHPRTTKEDSMPRASQLNFRNATSPREIEWTRILERWKVTVR